jgi:hypothetical protein
MPLSFLQSLIDSPCFPPPVAAHLKELVVCSLDAAKCILLNFSAAQSRALCVPSSAMHVHKRVYSEGTCSEDTCPYTVASERTCFEKLSTLRPSFPNAAGSDIEALQYPPVIEQVKMRCRFLLSFAGKDLPEVLSLPLFAEGALAHPFRGQAVDANSLGWAMAAVSSRAFRVHGPTKPAALLPLVGLPRGEGLP